MAGKEFKPGDEVAWGTSQGETHGTVERRVTKPTKVKGFTGKASPAHPEFLVKSDKSGAEAVHKPEELRKAPRKQARKPASKRGGEG